MLAQTKEDDLLEVERLFEKIKLAELDYEQEHRKRVREKVMIPIDIECEGSSQHGFSRDLSSAGVSVVTNQPIESGTEATLRLNQLDGDINSVRAACKWSKAFGSAHCVSGWKFLGMAQSDAALI